MRQFILITLGAVTFSVANAELPESVSKDLVEISRARVTIPLNSLKDAHSASNTPIRAQQSGDGAFIIAQNRKTGAESVVGYIANANGQAYAVISKELYKDLSSCDCDVPGAFSGDAGVSTPSLNSLFSDNLEEMRKGVKSRKDDGLTTPSQALKDDPASESASEDERRRKEAWLTTPQTQKDSENSKEDFSEWLKRKQQTTGTATKDEYDKTIEKTLGIKLDPPSPKDLELQKQKDAEALKAIRDSGVMKDPAFNQKGEVYEKADRKQKEAVEGRDNKKMQSGDPADERPSRGANKEEKPAEKGSEPDKYGIDKSSLGRKQHGDNMTSQLDQMDQEHKRRKEDTTAQMMKDAGLVTKEEARTGAEENKKKKQQEFESSLKGTQKKVDFKGRSIEEAQRARGQIAQQQRNAEQERIREEKERAKKEGKLNPSKTEDEASKDN